MFIRYIISYDKKLKPIINNKIQYGIYTIIFEFLIVKNDKITNVK